MRKNRRKKEQKISFGKRQVTVDGMAPGGWGISGRGKDRVHIWGAMPGDRLDVRIVRQMRGRKEAVVVQVIERQTAFADAACAHFDVCGGCLWQHVPYEKQLILKHEMVRSCFAGMRLHKDVIQPVLPCPDPLFYRNKTDFTFGFDRNRQPSVGFFESPMKISCGQESGDRGRVPPVFNVGECLLQSEVTNRIVAFVRQALANCPLSYYHPGSRRGILRSLVVRQSVSSGDVLVHFVAALDCGDTLEPLALALMQQESAVKGVVLSINKKRSKNAPPQSQRVLSGQGWITEHVLGLTVRVSPTSFLQVNTKQAERLYRVALDCAELATSDRVIDLYCGTGTLSLLMAQQAKDVVGIEVVASAVDDAEENARQNQISNCHFLCGDVQQVLPAQEMPDVVMVNPPRSGVDRAVIDQICSVSPKRIVYVSCNPETLARDLMHFMRGHYVIKSVQPVDMFPQTPHVEVVVQLVRRSQ